MFVTVLESPLSALRHLDLSHNWVGPRAAGVLKGTRGAAPLWMIRLPVNADMAGSDQGHCQVGSDQGRGQENEWRKRRRNCHAMLHGPQEVALSKGRRCVRQGLFVWGLASATQMSCGN